MTRSYANRQIAAAALTAGMEPIGSIPANEYQARQILAAVGARNAPTRRSERLGERGAGVPGRSTTRTSTRNLRPDQITIIMGRRYKAEKKPEGGDRKSSDQNEHLKEKTAAVIAESAGVGQATVRVRLSG